MITFSMVNATFFVAKPIGSSENNSLCQLPMKQTSEANDLVSCLLKCDRQQLNALFQKKSCYCLETMQCARQQVIKTNFDADKEETNFFKRISVSIDCETHEHPEDCFPFVV